LLGNGRLVLGDLGISKVLDGTMDFAQTCIGTPYYMSPEIFQNKPYSYKSDVWALGCVLYEMTTLNHAFDANSLNGLATKIVKGKYPPIHAKYSRYLRELISQMLMINPQLRPDVDQVLRKPFIKKHTVNFFIDIAARPSTSIGEGTMVFKGAAGGVISGNVNDSNVLALRQQLHSLDMSEAVTDAMKPKSSPQDDEEAIKLAREQASALKREQEHKMMVEAALEKLRLEREIRTKQRANEPKRSQIQNSNIPSARREEGVVKRPPNNAIQPSQNRNQIDNAKRDISVAGGRDRGLRKPDDVVRNEESGVGRRRTFGEEKERERIDREKKLAEERKRNSLEQEAAKARAEDRRREEVRAEAKAREEARLREEAKLREEQAERMRMEQVRERAEQAAKAKREAQRERERERQREEIEQLKRDKIELDRRTTERERLREERRTDERLRLENVRREQMDVVQYKLDNMNDQIQKLDLVRNRPNDDRNDDYLSAREKLYKRQERGAKEDNDQRDSEVERRQRGQQDFRPKAIEIVDQSSLETPRYEFDGVNRRSTKSKLETDDSLHERLEEARGKLSRFDVENVPERRQSIAVSNKSKLSNGMLEDDGSDSGSEEDIWEKGNGGNNVEEEEEDLHRREEELQAELNFATQRVEELKRTLQETKSFLGPRLPTRQSRDNRVSGSQSKEAYEDEEDNEDLYEFEEADELEVYMYPILMYFLL